MNKILYLSVIVASLWLPQSVLGKDISCFPGGNEAVCYASSDECKVIGGTKSKHQNKCKKCGAVKCAFGYSNVKACEPDPNLN